MPSPSICQAHLVSSLHAVSANLRTLVEIECECIYPTHRAISGAGQRVHAMVRGEERRGSPTWSRSAGGSRSPAAILPVPQVEHHVVGGSGSNRVTLPDEAPQLSMDVC